MVVPEPAVPKLDTLSYLCHKVEVVDVYDGDTITIDINDRHVRIRLAGIDAPELNAKTQKEKNEAIQSRDYLESLLLDKEIIVLFEKSDTTLDGIHRGAFGRPIAYIFILEDGALPNVQAFVNQNMIATGKAIRSAYAVDFPVLFTDNFDVSDMRVTAWVNANIGKASVNTTETVITTWAEIKAGRK